MGSSHNTKYSTVITVQHRLLLSLVHQWVLLKDYYLPGTNYTVKIRALTRVGAGPFSDSITVSDLPASKLH